MAEDETFGPAEVCWAVCIPRATFHSYLARKYIHVESQGAGRARKFTFEQIVQIAVMGRLMNFSIRASAAAEWSMKVKLPIAESGDTLIVLQSGAAAVVHREPGEDIESVIAAHDAELRIVESGFPTPLPLECILLDVSEVAAWVRDRLSHPDPEWRDDGPPIPYVWGE